MVMLVVMHIPTYHLNDFNMVELPVCSGKPTIVMGQSDTLNICPDSTASATLTGTAGDYSGFTYQWDSSTNGTVWFPIAGANQEEYLAYSSANYPKILLPPAGNLRK